MSRPDAILLFTDFLTQGLLLLEHWVGCLQRLKAAQSAALESVTSAFSSFVATWIALLPAEATCEFVTKKFFTALTQSFSSLP